VTVVFGSLSDAARRVQVAASTEDCCAYTTPADSHTHAAIAMVLIGTLLMSA
jgi:hypothetical protein